MTSTQQEPTWVKGGNVLAIETAFPRISLALMASGELYLPETDLGTKRAAALHSALEELLDRANLDPAGIEHILVDQGPGSYTGLRVGLALAQTLEFTGGCQVHALYSCDIFAANFARKHSPGETFGVAMDARRRHWTLALYQTEASGLRRISEPRCLPREEFEASLTGIDLVLSPHEEVPGCSSPRRVSIPEARDLLPAFSLSRRVSRIQPIYLMPPV